MNNIKVAFHRWWHRFVCLFLSQGDGTGRGQNVVPLSQRHGDCLIIIQRIKKTKGMCQSAVVVNSFSHELSPFLSFLFCIVVERNRFSNRTEPRAERRKTTTIGWGVVLSSTFAQMRWLTKGIRWNMKALEKERKRITFIYCCNDDWTWGRSIAFISGKSCRLLLTTRECGRNLSTRY